MLQAPIVINVWAHKTSILLKGDKMNVDLKEFRIMMEYRKLINSTPLDEIEWFEDGKRLDIDKKLIREFEDLGLNNTDFITTKFYLNKIIF
jgi:hypothetical protein